MYNLTADTCIATVTGGNSSGVYLKLPSGENVFSYFGYLEKGTEVICRIKKRTTDYRLTRVDIETVNYL